MRPIIFDTTAIISLSRIGRFDLISEIFGEIIIPGRVYHEVVVQGKGRPGEMEVRNADWIHVREVNDRRKVELLGEYGLGGGEAEVIILASEMKAEVIVTDDDLANRAATVIGLGVIQTVEIILIAKEMGLVPSIRVLLDELRNKGFWLSDKVYNDALQKAGEA